ncbi:MAG: hypothetical protein P9X24_00230 [Candidatus Hatepunaea meridiana]|nr:hypothetical protein [Candidatus Hatepunaea meridiana]
MNRHQRKGEPNNTQVGIKFENLTLKHFKKKFPDLRKPFIMHIGYLQKKPHKFDMGCSEQKVIIECKSHTWTRGGNVPSAKLTTWDQAMLYFFLSPRSYRKLFVAKRDTRKSGESLCEYYLRTHSHLIPDEVEFWEVDEDTGKFARLEFDVTGGIRKHIIPKSNKST